ncbi:MAG: prepilin-type N-terminal cleavage/methylation domain-containing protein [Lachnospiraceae bacterium]|nr:prepilin-type N-terminal cleavage/methylation domain-containing protein [Lachnospiraceae bacterium]
MKKNKKEFFLQDNQGMSIVELLVIIAIVAVLTGVAVNLFGYMNGKQARQCAYKLEAAISEIRMETMSKSNGELDNVYLKIVNENDKIYAVRMIKGTEAKDVIGEKVTVIAIDTTGGESTISSGSFVPIFFNRATGALLAESMYPKFRITQGNTNYVVEVEPTTGRITCERQ